MSRKQKTYGICRLCGENKELTFEHVPPETVFNKGAVRNVSLDAVIKDTMKENKLPWEIMGKARYSSEGEEDFIYAVTVIPVLVNGMFQDIAGLSMLFGVQCCRPGSSSMNHLG